MAVERTPADILDMLKPHRPSGAAPSALEVSVAEDLAERHRQIEAEFAAVANQNQKLGNALTPFRGQSPAALVPVELRNEKTGKMELYVAAVGSDGNWLTVKSQHDHLGEKTLFSVGDGAHTPSKTEQGGYVRFHRVEDLEMEEALRQRMKKNGTEPIRQLDPKTQPKGFVDMGPAFFQYDATRPEVIPVGEVKDLEAPAVAAAPTKRDPIPGYQLAENPPPRSASTYLTQPRRYNRPVPPPKPSFLGSMSSGSMLTMLALAAVGVVGGLMVGGGGFIAAAVLGVLGGAIGMVLGGTLQRVADEQTADPAPAANTPAAAPANQPAAQPQTTQNLGQLAAPTTPALPVSAPGQRPRPSPYVTP